MYQKTSIKKKTLGQQTEDRLMEYILNQPIATGEKIPNELLKKRDAIGARGVMTMHLTYNRQAILEMIEERNRNQENTSDVSKKKYNI